MLAVTRVFNRTTLKQPCFLHNVEKFAVIQSLHTSKILFDASVQDSNPPVQTSNSPAKNSDPPVQNLIPARGMKREDTPVDWLPFPWERRPKYNIFEDSGDKIKAIIVDPSLPKPDFELSDELKTANETVKHMFSVATASVTELKEVCRRELIRRVQRHPLDFDSDEVKIAERTITIRRLFEHKALFGRREVRISRVMLPILIQRRNGALNRLRKIDNDRFLWLLEELDCYFKVPTLSLQKVFYCKKNDLRRLTKEYHDNLIAEKKAAYHEELKKEQELFVEEKKEALAWIEAEEKAIAALNV